MCYKYFFNKKENMIKTIYITTLLFIFIQSSLGQKVPNFQESLATYFDEIKVATSKHQQLWNKDLYGPILLVNPNTRQLFANFPDTAGILKQDGKIFIGFLPIEINIANTSTSWNGRNWAMIMLPLPSNKQDRINLLAHELFHVNQPSLGFQLFNTENNHLDQKDGRIFLRLELEALKKAIQSRTKSELKKHLTNALTFRKYRHMLYLRADTTENLLELNEGIAEYTGLSVARRTEKQTIEHFEQSINSFYSNPTFVRSFAYQTTPIYGYLLSKVKKGWNKEISIKTNLTNYFVTKLNISLPGDIKKWVELISNQYDGGLIILEENAREEKTKKTIAEFKSKFIEQPHFEIRFEQMQIAFDPGNIMPLEDKGTVYPNMRISDNWGVLTVKNGALMSPNWDKISITIPLNIDNKNISGDGWTLELKDGYSILKDDLTGNFKLTKK